MGTHLVVVGEMWGRLTHQVSGKFRDFDCGSLTEAIGDCKLVYFLLYPY